MAEAAQEAIEYTEGISRPEFDISRPLQHSVVRCIEVIGDAASRLSSELRSANPDIPWQDIIGMRNRLVHAYFDINLDIIWGTAHQELPELLPKLLALLETRD